VVEHVEVGRVAKVGGGVVGVGVDVLALGAGLDDHLAGEVLDLELRAPRGSAVVAAAEAVCAVGALGAGEQQALVRVVARLPALDEAGDVPVEPPAVVVVDDPCGVGGGVAGWPVVPGHTALGPVLGDAAHGDRVVVGVVGVVHVQRHLCAGDCGAGRHRREVELEVRDDAPAVLVLVVEHAHPLLAAIVVVGAVGEGIGVLAVGGAGLEDDDVGKRRGSNERTGAQSHGNDRQPFHIMPPF